MKLPRTLSFAPFAAFALVAVAAYAQPRANPACIKSRGEVRARAVGYDHIVIIENGCDKAAECVISTDVAPDPITATVEAKTTVELTTFRGSPATVFKPTVSCKLR